MNRFLLSMVLTAATSLPAATFTRTTSSLDRLVSQCKKAEGNLMDFFACPRVDRYSYKAAVDLKKLPELFEKHSLSPKVTTAKKGVSVIRESIEGPISGVGEIRPGLESEDLKTFDKAFDKYVEATESFLMAISAAATNADQVLVDEDTYWAASVNARALVIVNTSKKAVTIVWHGDVDG